MKESLINVVEKFIDLCDSLYAKGRITDALYMEVTKNKIDFLDEVHKIG
ncbi:hypothetical protein [Marinisporobacter balticus]|uniref:Uncharacterized protein n=1 Tax=Marinisporobacter balticus TaxID=2018667 RepID=A0A4R2KEJ2_9FIRM|nr:hypothetical protein [Marinisporobacter balticus]TCO70722.1 hypothetical protein EV214_1249 [Marinisporobacter balticus]